MTNQQLNNS